MPTEAFPSIATSHDRGHDGPRRAIAARVATCTRRAGLVILAGLLLLLGSAALHTHADSPPEADHSAPEGMPGTGTDGESKQRPSFFETIRVTATRDERLAFEAPWSVDVLDAEALDLGWTPPSLPKALARSPGVMVQRTSRGQGSPFVRGFTGFRTLTLFDGVPLNNSVYREGPNQYSATIDPFGLQRIEVLRGPGSVLFGSGAVGGTIQVLPRFPAPSRATSDSWTAHYRGASAERSHAVRAEYAHHGSRWGVGVGTSLWSRGDLEGGERIGRQPRTSYDTRGANLNVFGSLGGDAVLKAAVYAFDQEDVPRTHKTVDGIAWHGTVPGNELRHRFDQKRRLAYTRLEWVPELGWIDDARVTVSHQQQREDRDRIRASGTRSLQGFDVDTTGIDLQYTSQHRLGRVVWGLTSYRDSVSSYRTDLGTGDQPPTERIQGPVADDARYSTASAFGHATFDLTDRAELSIGGRFERADASADEVADPEGEGAISVEDDWNALVGSARLLARPSERWRIYGGLSQGFRAPNLSDLTRFDSARSGEIETPSPGLSEERFLTSEAGVKWGGSRLGGELAVYWTEIDDMIVRFPTGRIVDEQIEVQKANVGDGRVFGYELVSRARITQSLRWGLQAFYARGDVANYPSADSRAQRLPMSRIPPFTVSSWVRWSRPGHPLWLQAELLAANEQDRLSPRDAADTQRIPPGGTPGYGVVHLRGGYDFRNAVSLTIALENVLDADYRIHGSGINEPGRGVVVALRFRGGSAP